MSRIILFSLILFVLTSFRTEAESSAVDIHEVCVSDYSKCLLLLEDEFEQVPEKTFKWYKLKLYQIEAFFQLKSVEERLELIETLLLLEEAPFNFKISLYIDYAKSHYLIKNYSLAKEYADKAFVMLEQSANAFKEPLKLVQLINLKTYLVGLDHKEGRISSPKEHHQQSYDFLLTLLEKNKFSTDMLMMTELHGNLGHLARHLGLFEKGIYHFEQAIYWTKLRKSEQQTGVGYFNVAMLYQKLKEYELALNYYNQAIGYFERSNNQKRIGMSKLNMVEVNLLNHNSKTAKLLFDTIKKADLFDYNLERYQQLKSELSSN